VNLRSREVDGELTCGGGRGGRGSGTRLDWMVSTLQYVNTPDALSAVMGFGQDRTPAGQPPPQRQVPQPIK